MSRLIIESHCQVGDIAWVIDADAEQRGKYKIYEAKWERVNLVQNKKGEEFSVHGVVSYHIYDYFHNDGRTMLHDMYVGQEATQMGKVVFLDKKDAENALVKLILRD